MLALVLNFDPWSELMKYVIVTVRDRGASFCGAGTVSSSISPRGLSANIAAVNCSKLDFIG